MGRLAVVALLPEPTDDANRADFASREFDTWEEFAAMMRDLDTAYPTWRVVTVCHVEDLPLIMEPPDDLTGG